MTKGLASLLSFAKDVISVSYTGQTVIDVRALNSRTLAVTGVTPGTSRVFVFQQQHPGDTVGRLKVFQVQVQENTKNRDSMASNHRTSVVPDSPIQSSVAMFSEYYQNKRFDFSLTQQRLNQTPPWEPTAEYPPLSPRKAMETAKAYLPRLVQDGEKWHQGDVTLRQVGSDKWVYQIQFIGNHPPGIIDGMVPTMRVVVLMDGEVAEPVVTERPPSYTIKKSPTSSTTPQPSKSVPKPVSQKPAQ